MFKFKKRLLLLLGASALSIMPSFLHYLQTNDSNHLKGTYFEKNHKVQYLENTSLAKFYEDIDQRLKPFSFENEKDLELMNNSEFYRKFSNERIFNLIKQNRKNSLKQKNNLIFIKTIQKRQEALILKLQKCLEKNIDIPTKNSLTSFYKSILNLNFNQGFDFVKNANLILQIINFDLNALEYIENDIAYLNLIDNLYASTIDQITNSSALTEIKNRFAELKDLYKNEKQIDFVKLSRFKEYINEQIVLTNESIDQKIIDPNTTEIFNDLFRIALEIENLKTKDSFFPIVEWKGWSYRIKTWIKNKELTRKKDLALFFYYLLKDEYRQITINNELTFLFRIVYAKNVKKIQGITNNFENFLIATDSNLEMNNFNNFQKKINSLYFNNALFKKREYESIEWELYKNDKKTYFEKHYLKDDIIKVSHYYDDFLTKKNDDFISLNMKRKYYIERKFIDDISKNNHTQLKVLLAKYLQKYIFLDREIKVKKVQEDFEFSDEEIVMVNKIYEEILGQNFNIELLTKYALKLIEKIHNKIFDFYQKHYKQSEKINYMVTKTLLNFKNKQDFILKQLPDKAFVFNFDYSSIESFNNQILSMNFDDKKLRFVSSIDTLKLYVFGTNANSMNFNSNLDGLFKFWDTFLKIKNDFKFSLSEILKINWSYALKSIKEHYTQIMSEILDIVEFAEQNEDSQILKYVLDNFAYRNPNEWKIVDIKELEKLYLKKMNSVKTDGTTQKWLENYFKNEKLVFKKYLPNAFSFYKNKFDTLIEWNKKTIDKIENQTNDIIENKNIQKEFLAIKKDILNIIKKQSLFIKLNSNTELLDEILNLINKVSDSTIKQKLIDKHTKLKNDLENVNENTYKDVLFGLLDFKYEVILELANQEKETRDIWLPNEQNVLSPAFQIKNLYASNKEINLLSKVVLKNEISILYQAKLEGFTFYKTTSFNKFQPLPGGPKNAKLILFDIKNFFNQKIYLLDDEVMNSNSIDELFVLEHLFKDYKTKEDIKSIFVSKFNKQIFFDRIQLDFELTLGDEKIKVNNVIVHNTYNYYLSQVALNEEANKSLKNIFVENSIFNQEDQFIKDNLAKNIWINNPKLKLFIDESTIVVDKANKKITMKIFIFEYDSDCLTLQDYKNKNKVYFEKANFEYTW
ncbi:hypothetical protein ACJA25_00160 [Mycoplasmopsis hyopharyngis]|uniref:hypothetical protein n=1 Tax=Mycoplasmopsis hyopharyngis TaxID=29558 RepID=UPI0038732744